MPTPFRRMCRTFWISSKVSQADVERVGRMPTLFALCKILTVTPGYSGSCGQLGVGAFYLGMRRIDLVTYLQKNARKNARYCLCAAQFLRHKGSVVSVNQYCEYPMSKRVAPYFARKSPLYRYLYFILSSLKLRSYSAWKSEGEPNPFASLCHGMSRTTRPEVLSLFVSRLNSSL